MATCDSCGNEYDKPLEITKDGQTHTFDSFECAIHKLAPRCDHCGVTIIGHGLQAGADRFFCCAHCAKQAGVEELADRV
jgi:hypothetical protein